METIELTVNKTTLSLASLEEIFGNIERQIAELEEVKSQTRSAILEKMDAEFGHYSHTFTNEATGGSLIRAVKVTQKANESALKRILTGEEWNMVKKESVDMSKLMAAIEVKQINPAKIAVAIETKEQDSLAWKVLK